MPTKNRNLSLLRTFGSTALRATGEALKNKLSKSKSQKENANGSPEGAEETVSQAALRLVRGLDELKGAAMKMGQMLSLEKDLLPAAWQNALSALQAQSTPRSYSEMENVLKKSLFPLELGEVFESIEPEALHAASMSQVHRGSILHENQHTPVAIKIRYPGLKENVGTDLKSLSRILKFAGVVANETDIKRLMSKIREVFEQELNFEIELQNTLRFAEFLKTESQIETAVPLSQFCREDLLVTTWLEGVGLDEWLKTAQPSAAERSRIGTLLVRETLLEIFRFGWIQTDPNPANFLVLKNGNLGLVDFGAVTELPSRLVQAYRSLALASLEGTKAQVIEAGKELGFLTANDSTEAFDSFVRMMAFTSEPFRSNQFNWGTSPLAEKIKEESLKFARFTKLRIPPEDLIFLNRRILGTQLFLEKLAPEVSTRDLFDEIVRQKS